LLDHHRAAAARFGSPQSFPVKDGTPKFPGTVTAARGELVPPLETGVAPAHPSAPETLAPGEEPASYYWHPESATEDADGFSKREPDPDCKVPEKGTAVPDSGTSLLKTFNAFNVSVSLEGTTDTEALNAFNAEFPNREPSSTASIEPGQSGWRAPLDPTAKEADVIRWLVGALGEGCMTQWGGMWRNAWRECPLAVLEAVGNYKLRVQGKGQPDFPGAWLRDQYNRFRRVIKAAADHPKPNL